MKKKASLTPAQMAGLKKRLDKEANANLEFGMEEFEDLVFAELMPRLDFLKSENTITAPVTYGVDHTIWRSDLEVPEEHRLPRRDGEIIILHAVGYFDHRTGGDADPKGTKAVFAAVERSAKYWDKYLGGLIEVVNPDAKVFLVASGAAVSQSREAVRQSGEIGDKVGLIKIKTIRPFPTALLRDALKNANYIFVPEFNHAGWMHKEICSVLYGHSDAKIIDGPRVYGGMTMPTEMILEWLKERVK